MGNGQIAQLEPDIPEQKNVDVDDARSPTPGRPATTLSLDRFDCCEQLTRSSTPLALNDLIEKSRLVLHTPRLGLDDAALTQHVHAPLTQTAPRGAEVASARSEV